MQTHTPGPWAVWSFTDDPRHIAVGPDAGGLAVADIVGCNAHGCYTAETEERGMLNARLIAAAPELLAALQDVIGLAERGAKHGNDPEMTDLWMRGQIATARAAIAKAGG